jgi:hypothetical protein
VDADVDVATSDQSDSRPLAPPLARAPGATLAAALAEWPAPLLWEELRHFLPPDLASKMLDAAGRAARA